jgi:membrane-associated phospholipid phosphatase
VSFTYVVAMAAAMDGSAHESTTHRDPARRWWLLAGAGVAVVLLSYVPLVLTSTGQAIENAALRGADQVDPAGLDEAQTALNAITVGSLLMGCLLVAAWGLLRHSVTLAVAGVGTIIAGQVITQSLKRIVLPRPALVDATAGYAGNSFPSGHTTIALTVLTAVLILSSYRWRGWVVLLTSSWATGIAAYTLTAKWHRLSDTLGAAGVTLLVGSLAALWLHRQGLVRSVEGPPRLLRVIVIAGLLTPAAVIGVLLGGLVLVLSPHLLDRDPVTDYNVYAAFQALAGAGSLATVLATWWGWHRLEVVPARGPRRP